MNPSSDQDREKLSRGMAYAYEQLSPFRRARRDLVEDYAGSRYGMDAIGLTKPPTYVNLIQDLVRALKTALAYNDPRFLITSTRSETESFALRFQTALNTYVKRIHFGDTLRDIIGDAIFQVGIGKVFLADSPEVYVDNDIFMNPGMPYLGRVSLDDFCYDISKRDLRKASFICDRYSMDYETAKSCPYFDKAVREDLLASRYTDRAERWEMASSVSGFGDHTNAELEDVVDLVDVYLPKEKVVCTWPVYAKFALMPTKPLAVLPWDGAETGPYRFLSLIDIPDNIMPTSPAQSLAELFYLFNFLMRRIAQRAKQAKTVLPFEPGAGEDLARAMEAKDMQTVKVNRIKSIDVLQFPGPDQSLVNFTYGLQELFSRAAGNLENMLGTGPTASTLGQSQMIDERVGAQLAEYRKQVTRFTAQCGEDVAALLWDDPMQVIPGERKLPGTNYSINADWMPPDVMPRPMSFQECGIEVEPYSMEYRSPQQQLGEIFQIVQQVAPLMPLAQQQGQEFQFQEFIKDVAELSGQPRVSRWFRAAPPPMVDGTEGGGAPQRPGVGQYTRTNVSAGPTSSGRLQQYMQMGGEQQPVIQGAQ